MARVGCPMAHCDVRMSDRVRLFPPIAANPIIRAHDWLSAGVGNPALPANSANQGLGCASNGRVVVCAYSNPDGHNVVAYSPEGVRLWTSGAHLDASAFASVPLVARDGGVIAADAHYLIRFDPSGAILWKTPTPGGTPISPVLTQSGVVVLATKRGPVSAFQSTDGRLLGSLWIRDEAAPDSFFETSNTPCVQQNRVYEVAERADDVNHTARLVAIDVNPDDLQAPLRVAWHYSFGGPSRTSPLCRDGAVYFAGDRFNPGDPKAPYLFAVRDQGSSGALLWAHRVANSLVSSPAEDPRGGFWVYVAQDPHLYRHSTQTFALMESLDVSVLVNDPRPNFPWSILSIAGSASRPFLLLGTTDANGLTAYVVAIDLVGRALLWKLNIRPSFSNDTIPSQFPIAIDARGKAVVVPAGRTSGAYFITEP